MTFSNLELELAKSLDSDVYAALVQYRESGGLQTIGEAHARLLRTALFGSIGRAPEWRIPLAIGDE